VDALWRALEVAPPDDARRLEGTENASGGPRPALSEETWGMVRAYYESSDRDLAELLGRCLPW
jgi:hypothetical protein